MSQITEINQQIITAIIKTDPFYQVLWGNEEFTPESEITAPNDYNCGAIANPLEYLYAFIREITEKDITVLEAPYIDIVIYFFTGIKRFIGEDNEAVISRMQSLIVRECDWRSERFGTPWDIINVFCYYLDKSFLFYVPNKVITNIIINGDFEDVISGEWTILPSGDRSISDSFSGSYCLDFSAFDSAAQTISVTAGSYILNAFVKPQEVPLGVTPLVKVNIQRNSDSKYFDTFLLEWVVSNPDNTYSTDREGYNIYQNFIIVDGSYDITVTYEKIEDIFLDHIELGLKLYPYFEIIYIDTGVASDFSSVWVDGETNFEFASFLDQTFMLGSATSAFSDAYYQSILDDIKPSGVRAVFTREAKI